MSPKKVLLQALLSTIILDKPWVAQGKDSNEESGSEIIEVQIPTRLRDRGYEVNINNDFYELKGKTVNVVNEKGRKNARKAVELHDSNGRLVDKRSTRILPEMLDSFRNRAIRFSLGWGGAWDQNGKLRKLYATSAAYETELEVDYIPSFYGIQFSYSNLKTEEGYGYIRKEVDGEYQAEHYRLGPKFEFSPWGFSDSRFARRLRTTLSLGVLASKNKVQMTDSIVTVTDKSDGFGGWGEFGFNLPMFTHSFFQMKYGATYQELKFKKLGFSEDLTQTHFSIGGGYEF